MKYILFIGLIFTVLSCKQKSIPSAVQETKPVEIEQENDLANLYQHYHNNPYSQLQKDENKIIDYIADQELNFQRSPSLLYYHIKKTGAGPYITKSNKIKAHYKGNLINGEVFDSSYKRNQPLEFKIGQMIPAWNEVLPKLRKGDSAILLVPSYLAYGPDGFDGYIGPNEALQFELEIVDLK